MIPVFVVWSQQPRGRAPFSLMVKNPNKNGLVQRQKNILLQNSRFHSITFMGGGPKKPCHVHPFGKRTPFCHLFCSTICRGVRTCSDSKYQSKTMFQPHQTNGGDTYKWLLPEEKCKPVCWFRPPCSAVLGWGPIL